MASNLIQSTFSNTYKDDYNDSDNYHRVLFNSGRSLQARELTQLQTIIQSEIKRFGDWVFSDGAAVNPASGGISVNNEYRFIKLDATSNDFGGYTIENIVGVFFTGENGITVRVLQAVAAVGSDPATIYVKYEKNETAGFYEIQGSETLTSTDGLGRELIAQATNPTGNGCIVKSSGGTFYTQGHFVYAPPQDLIVSKYTSGEDVNARIGYKVEESIVTVSDDEALYDNQGVNPNRAAPGADRYRIRLRLATETSVAATDAFVPFFDLVNGAPANAKTGIEDNKKLDEKLAQRTSEESGNYLVNPFKIEFLSGESDGELFLEIDPFTAYVKGNRVTGGNKTSPGGPVRIKPPTSTTSSDDYSNTVLSSYANYGNYVILDSANVANTARDGQSVANFYGSLLDSVTINSSVDGTGNAIGRARISQLLRTTRNEYVAFLSGVTINPGKTFANAKSLVRDTGFVPTTGRLIINADGGSENTQLQDPGTVNFFRPLYKNRPASTSVVSFEVQREFAQSSDGLGGLTLTGNIGESFVDEDNWIIINTTDDVVVDNATLTINLTAGDAITPPTADFIGLTASKNHLIFAYVKKLSPAAIANKTLTTQTILSAPVKTDTNGDQFIGLAGRTDIYEIDSVRADSAGGQDISSLFTLDNGQRLNVYEPGRLRANSKLSLIGDPGNVYVKFKYFSHSTSGNYYSISSYTLDNTFEYGDIPVFRQGDLKINLFDVLDFRSDVDSNGTITKEIELPRHNSLIEYKMSSYNSRIDILYADANGIVDIQKGAETLSPSAPEINPKQQMPLYTIRYGANTLNTNDISVKPFIHKRFTMKDISDLESRIIALEEAVSLSLLESKTTDLTISAEDGTIRAKSGFFVDNFKNYPAAVASEKSSIFDPDNRTSSIDFNTSLVHAKAITTGLDLVYDSDGSTNTKRRGDNVYANYIQQTSAELTQEKISETKNVNPFMITMVKGFLTISPASDTWVDTRRIPDRVVSRGVEINQTVTPDGSMNWWEFGWNGEELPEGIDPNNVQVGDTINSSSTVTGTNTTTTRRFAGLEGRRVTIPGQPGLTFGGESEVGGTPDRTETQWRVRTQTGVTTTTTGINVTDRVTGIDTIREVVGDRVVQSIFLPFMRQKMIYFKASGLRPNTRHYPFFDGVNVGQWCREEVFRRTSERLSTDTVPETEFFTSGNLEHPRGQSTLISDNNGEITGSFLLPNRGRIIQDWQNEIRRNTSISSERGIEASKDFRIFNQIGWRFRAGTRSFRLLDVPRYDLKNTLSYAATKYTSQGRLDTWQRDISLTRVITVERDVDNWSTQQTNWGPVTTGEWQTINTRAFVDPIAQSFAIDRGKYPYGMFLTSVDVFLKSAPGVNDVQVPIHLQIRRVENGIPVTEFSNDQTVSKSAADVRTAISGQQQNSASVLAHPVNFEFEEPVYLEAGEIYAIVLIADTDKYEAYISTVFQYELGSTTKRITKQPTLGSFFESQNASTWSPLQNSDLAYRLYAAKFRSGTSTAKFVNRQVPKYHLGDVAALSIDSGSTELYVRAEGHGLLAGDNPKIRGLDSTSRYAGILGSEIMSDLRTVNKADTTGFTVNLLTSATDSAQFGTDQLRINRNFFFDKINFNVNSIITPPNTSSSARASFITGQSYAEDPSAGGNDTRFFRTPSTGHSPITLNKNIVFTEPKMIANDSAEVLELGSGNKSVELLVDLTNQTRNTLFFCGTPDANFPSDVSAFIDTQRVSAVLINNLIDNQDSVAGTLKNVPIKFVAEENALSGSAPSKHLTKPVITAEPGIALKVNFDAYRPVGSNINVYYRTCQAEENIYDFPFVRMNPVTDGYPAATQPPADEKQAIFSAFEFFAGDPTGVDTTQDLETFTQYQVKLVFRSENTSNSPILQNIRVVSLAT